MSDDKIKMGLEEASVEEKRAEKKLLQEGIENLLGNGFAVGQKVLVKRSDGRMEDDWQLKQVYEERVMVSKRNSDGVMMTKMIGPEVFLTLNKPIGVSNEKKADNLPYIYEGQGGDDIFEILKERMVKEGLIVGPESPEIILYIIGSALNEVKKKGSDVIQKAGISSGNPLLIYKGDTINLDEVINLAGGKENLFSIVQRAKNLSPEHLDVLRKIAEEESEAKKNRMVPSEAPHNPDVGGFEKEGGTANPTTKPEEIKENLESEEVKLPKNNIEEKEVIKKENEKPVDVPSPLSTQEQEATGFGLQEQLDKATKDKIDEEIRGIFNKEIGMGLVGNLDYMEEWRRIRNQDMQRMTEFGVKYEQGGKDSEFATPERDRALLLWQLITQKRELSGVKPFPTESVESYLLRSTREIIAREAKPTS